jgi:high-affinity iron transporter
MAVRGPKGRSTSAGFPYWIIAPVLLLIGGIVAWQWLMSTPDPTIRTSAAAGVIDVGILVFREGLECVLVLAAITASMSGATEGYRRPVAAGATAAFAATLLTWLLAVKIVDDLGNNIPALELQAWTGLLAIVVLVVIMNWFFHKVYWTGWISMHTDRKRELLQSATGPEASRTRLLWGFAILGFTSLYREGFEVVLFLQSYRLKLGNEPVGVGVIFGLALTAIVGILAFVSQRHLPYRKMLVATGVMLGVVLVVMVGEQAQEMQLAHWLSVTRIGWLDAILPSWVGLWFAVFATVETLAAQALAILLVLGSYIVAGIPPRRRAKAQAAHHATARRRSA